MVYFTNPPVVILLVFCLFVFYISFHSAAILQNKIHLRRSDDELDVPIPERGISLVFVPVNLKCSVI